MNYRLMTVAGLLSAFVGMANAAFDQIGTGAGADTNGFATQNISDFAPNYNIMALEDMTTGAVHVDSVDMVFFFFNSSTPDVANITGWQFAVYKQATGASGSTDTSNTGDVANAHVGTGAATFTPNFNGVTGNYLVHVDLTSANINLAAGSYWFGLAGDMAFTGPGEIGVAGTTMVDASSAATNARQMNGGGGFGAGTNFVTNPADNLSYRLNTSAVPEPATMAALGLGVAAMIRRRRNG